MIQCNMCDRWFLATEILDHLELDHDIEDMERWPDGRPVIVDTTLEPEDFSWSTPR